MIIRRRVISYVAVGTLALAAAFLITVSGRPAPVTAGPPPLSLVAALGAAGIELHALPPALASSADLISLADAEQAARDQYRVDAPALVYLGQLVVDGPLGGTQLEATLTQRPVYAVAFGDLALYPMGKYGDPPPDERSLHTEEVVFIDAASGTFLFSASVR